MPQIRLRLPTKFLKHISACTSYRSGGFALYEDGRGFLSTGGHHEADLFADFCTDRDLAGMPGSHWVKSSKKRAIHEECDQVTGAATK